MNDDASIVQGDQAWTILLIDDEADIGEVVSIVLEDRGFQVSTAQDGMSGLALCEQLRPRIVLTDIRMPGMDGIQVLQAVKERYPETEVIVVTAFGEMDIAVKALQLDASDFITKPIQEDVLMVAVERAKQRYTEKKALRDYARFLEKENARTTEELLKTYRLQKNLIESSMDGILACDENGRVLAFNRSMEQITGREKSEVIQKMRLSDFFAPGEADKFDQDLAKETFGGPDRLFLYETALMGKNGIRVPVQVSAGILWNNGTAGGLVCYFRDLREIRTLERQIADQAGILHQDKMMSLGRLSASVVHEINNPLFGVLNYVRLMIRILERGSLSDESVQKFQRYLDLVEKETERCSNIVSNLLTFSRKSEPAFGQVDLDELFQRSILLSRHKLELSDIVLKTRIDPDLPRIKGDLNQLQQCMINLIFNAVDAMPGGGVLTLVCRYEREAGKVVIEVQDTGTGIREQDIPHIFEPFFTTKKEGYGVGLGLSTVYGIIQRHTGTVTVDSKPGDTRFVIHLPA